MIRWWLAAALVAAAAVVVTRARAAEPQPTAAVERRDLVDREDIAGTLGFADPAVLNLGVSGTLTTLRDPGSVVTRGHSLYGVDGAPAAFLLYGELPAWRDFAPGMSDGDDVRQLERNLRALGYDPGDVDREWTWETTEAVQAFEADRGLDDDGRLPRGTIVFRAGAVRMGESKAALGDAAAPGRPLAEIASTRRIVTVELDAARRQIAREGDQVTVTLPSGREIRGRIETVGKVAGKHGDATTVPVTIAVTRRAGDLDQAPVDVGFAVDRRRGALAVPVGALLARQGGGYAVELAGGRLVPVEPGLYADDMVEVTGDLREGQRVVTAR